MHIHPLILLFFLYIFSNQTYGQQSPFLTKKYSAVITRSNGKKINVKVARSIIDQRIGLSGVPANKFGRQDGLLFWYKENASRPFWMIDTHFDLKIIFLNQNFKVVHISKLSHYPSKIASPSVPKTKSIFCRYVLEVKPGTIFSKDIKLGEQFKFKSI